MAVNVSEERKKLFEERLSNWLASQGVFFQLRHAGLGGDGGNSGRILALLLRLLLMLLVLGGLFYFFGNRWMASESFQNGLEDRLTQAFNAEEVELEGYRNEGGQVHFKSMVLEGGEESFFFGGELGTVSAAMPFSALWKKNWQLGKVETASAHLRLKSGGSENMTGVYRLLFGDQDGFDLTELEIKSASLEWGYSKLTHGKIRDTSLRARRDGDRWTLTMEGGYFQQNWLRELRIKKMRLTLGKEGITVERADFLTAGKGKASMTGTVSGSAVRPEIALKMQLENVPLENVLSLNQVNLEDYFDGEIGGEIEIFGFADQAVKTRGKIVLNKGQSLILRDGWPILKALSVVDVDQSYRRTVFSEGGFSFETGNGLMQVMNLDMSSPGLLKWKGNFETYLPNQKEAAKALDIKLTSGGMGPLDRSEALSLESERMSLDGFRKRPAAGKKDAAADSRKAGDDEAAEFKNMSPEEVEGMRLRQEMATHIVRGEVEIGVKPDSFRKHKRLMKLYPEKNEGWAWIPLNLHSRMAKVSDDEAQIILKEARRDKFLGNKEN